MIPSILKQEISLTTTILQNINLWTFRSNDTLRADYWLKDYYAYDDGLADYSVALTAFGNRAAYLFEMLTAEPDTLVGFDIYYPDYGVPSNLIVDFTVYNDIDGLPGIPIYTLPSYSISRNGTKFKEIRFGEQFLVKDKFYIGWKAPVGGTFKIGLDTNNDSGSKLFVNTNGFWFQSTDVIGSVMIRPVFGMVTLLREFLKKNCSHKFFRIQMTVTFLFLVTLRSLRSATLLARRSPIPCKNMAKTKK